MGERGSTRDLLLFLALCVAGMGLGGAFGHPGAGAAVALFAQLLIGYRRLRSLQRWLDEPGGGEPPVQDGVLGEIAERIQVLQRRQSAEIDALASTLGHLRDSYSALKDGIVVLRPDRGIEWCNASACAMLALRYPEDVGQPFTNLVRNVEVSRYLGQPPYEGSVELPAPDHSERRLELQAAQFGRDNLVLFVRDVTALRHLETMRQDFIANISHELRTPLTVIKGYVGVLDEQLGSTNAPLAPVLGQMRQQVQRMENLLRDLILLSRLESMDAQDLRGTETVAVEPLLEALRANALAACGGERDITLRCEPGCALHGSRETVESIFSNLIFNAVKYTAPGGRITVEFTTDAAGASFRVSDDGIGIDAVHIPRLTERFYRVDASRSLERGGTGLGLAIVKHALKRLGGELEVSSRLGHGSVFCCHFPAARVARSDP